jgi:hypothetical protein
MSMSSCKTLFFLLTATLTFSLFSCAKKSANSDSNTQNQNTNKNKTEDIEQLTDKTKIDPKNKTDHPPCPNSGKHQDCPHAKKHEKHNHHAENNNHKGCPNVGKVHENCPHSQKKKH